MDKITIIIGVFVVVAVVGVLTWRYSDAKDLGEQISPAEAYQMAKDNEILLIDIRRPDEWKNTGIGEGAIPLDMRDKTFIEKLKKIVEEKGINKVAVICARGGRSKQLAKKLRKNGFENVIDVPEGMIGHSDDTGWINRKLPLKEI